MCNRSYRRCENSNVLGAADINTTLGENSACDPKRNYSMVDVLEYAYNQDIINEIFLV